MQDIYLYKKAKAILNIKNVQEITEHLNLLSCYNINNEIVFTKKQMDYNFIDTIEELIKFMYPNDSILNITQNYQNDKIEFEIELEIDTKLRTIEFLKVYTFNDTDFYKLNIDDFRSLIFRLNNNPFSFVENVNYDHDQSSKKLDNKIKETFLFFLDWYMVQYKIEVYKIEGKLYYTNEWNDEGFWDHEKLLKIVNDMLTDPKEYFPNLLDLFKELIL